MLQFKDRPILTETDLAYLAGLFDGEGTAGVYKHSCKSNSGKIYSTSTASVKIRMTDRDPVAFVALCLPGWFGKVRPTIPTNKQIYGWQAQCASAYKVAKALLPFVKNPSKQGQLQAVVDRGDATIQRYPWRG